MMTFIRILSPMSPPQILRSRSIGAVNKFVIHSTIPGYRLGFNSRANMFSDSDDSDVLQDNRLKNDHPLGVPFLISYAVKLHCEG